MPTTKPHMPLTDALLDLASRFIVNVPAEERSSFDRVFWQIEQAHWFYEDEYKDQFSGLHTMKLPYFCELMFNNVPVLSPWAGKWKEMYAQWMSYKITVPVCGAIIINPEFTHTLLVKSWGSKGSWGFPKGKINRNEDPLDCAVREVKEECGFDILPFVDPDSCFEVVVRGQKTVLFLCPNVTMDTVFVTQTVKEISKIDWHRISHLPGGSNPATKGKYWMIKPFTHRLETWCKGMRQRLGIVDKKGSKKKIASLPPVVPPDVLAADPHNPFLTFAFNRPALAKALSGQ